MSSVVSTPPTLGVLDQRWCPKCDQAKKKSTNGDQSRVEFFCGTVVDLSNTQGVAQVVSQSHACKVREKRNRDLPI